MKPKPSTGIDKAGVRRRRAKRRHGIAALARHLEWIAAGDQLAVDVAGLPRYAELPLDPIIVRLEIVVIERPVDHRIAFGQSLLAEALDQARAHAEVGLAVPPYRAAPVQRAAAGADRRRQVQRFGGSERTRRPRQDLGDVAVARAPGDRVVGEVRHERSARVIADFVMLLGKIVRREMRPLVERRHIDAALSEFGGDDSASGSEANDDRVSRFGHFREPARVLCRSERDRIGIRVASKPSRICSAL